jgi:chitodextrinase
MRVEIIIDGVVNASLTSSPYNFTWDTTTVSNGAHTIQATAYDRVNNTGSSSLVNVTVNNDATPPTPPTNVVATASDYNRVDVTWTAATDNVGVVKYLIQRDTAVIAETTATSYSDTTVQANSTYSYTIVAVDAKDNASQPSEPATATTSSPPDSTPPTTPTNLVATAAGPTQANLSWDTSTDNIGVTGYDVFRDGVKINTVTVTSYGDATVSPGVSYTYTIQAVDGAGNKSPLSSPAVIVMPTPVRMVLTFTPTDDTYVFKKNPTTNYGQLTTLLVDASPIKDTLMKFTISGIGSRRIVDAKLRLYVTDGSNSGGQFYRTLLDTWTENTVTWNNAPVKSGNLITQLGAVKVNTWVDVNLTSLINGDATYSVRVPGTLANGANYASKENSNVSARPQLIVTVEE